MPKYCTPFFGRTWDFVNSNTQVPSLKQKGAAWVGKCPFHEEKTGSFNVRPGKGYKCFGCGVGGDALGFVMRAEGLEFVPAVVAVAERLGVAYSTAKENITRVRVKYVEVGRPAPTKVDLLRRAMEDGILHETPETPRDA